MELPISLEDNNPKIKAKLTKRPTLRYAVKLDMMENSPRVVGDYQGDGPQAITKDLYDSVASPTRIRDEIYREEFEIIKHKIET